MTTATAVAEATEKSKTVETPVKKPYVRPYQGAMRDHDLSLYSTIGDVTGLGMQTRIREIKPFALTLLELAKDMSKTKGSVSPIAVYASDVCESLGLPDPLSIYDVLENIPTDWQLCPSNMVFDYIMRATEMHLKVLGGVGGCDEIVLMTEPFVTGWDRHLLTLRRGGDSSMLHIGAKNLKKKLGYNTVMVFIQKSRR